MSSLFANVSVGPILAGLAAVITLILGVHLSAALAGASRAQAGSNISFGRGLVATLGGAFVGVAITVGLGFVLGEMQAGPLALAASVPGLWLSYRIAQGLGASVVDANRNESLAVETMSGCFVCTPVEEECPLPTA